MDRTTTLRKAGQWSLGVLAVCVATAATAASDGASDNQRSAAWDEFRRFTPFMASATETGVWSASPAWAADLAALPWSEPRLRAVASRVERVFAVTQAGELISAQRGFNEQNLLELIGLGLESKVRGLLGDTGGQTLTEAEVIARLIEAMVWQAMGSMAISEARLEHAAILSDLNDIAADLAGPPEDVLPVRFEVWADSDMRRPSLRAINTGEADLSGVVVWIECGLDTRPTSRPVRQLVYVDSWPAGEAVELPAYLVSGMPTAHAPRLQERAMGLSIWGETGSFPDRSLDMPGYARDQRIPGPNAVGQRIRRHTARYLLVEDAYAQPRPMVIDPSGEPVEGWDRAEIRPTRAMDASQAASAIVRRFT